MMKRLRNYRRWQRRRERILKQREALFLADLTAMLRGQLSVVESRVQYAYEQAGLDRLAEAVSRPVVSPGEFDGFTRRSAA